MNASKPSVLACVTDQYSCDRIIKTAKDIANRFDMDLRVLSVLKPTADYSSVSDCIEYLYQVSKEAEADMTVLFNSEAPKAAAQFAKDNAISRIVTGMHGGGDNSFIVEFNRQLPLVPITMVSKDDTVYSLELVNTVSVL